MHKRLFGIAASLIALVALMMPAGVAWGLTPSTIYNSLPAPLPPNVVSLGYQATQTQEFGDYIKFAGTNRGLTTVTVTMSDWAKHSNYPSLPAAGWTHPITLNIYEVDLTGSAPALGDLILTQQQTFTIPWRPEADPTCPDGKWRAADSMCYSGLAFNITFDLTSLNQWLPDQIIYGIAYNTNTWGYNPIGAPGPYESLNVGLNTTSPSVGSDVETDAVFWNTRFAAWYSDGGPGGTFRRDTNWTPYTPAVQFNAVPDITVCKNGGWQSYLAPAMTFKNQGDCIQYVNTGQ